MRIKPSDISKTREVSSVMKKEMIAMLLAGGQGSRLGVLTAKVAKPAVSFGGKYRLHRSAYRAWIIPIYRNPQCEAAL